MSQGEGCNRGDDQHPDHPVDEEGETTRLIRHRGEERAEDEAENAEHSEDACIEQRSVGEVFIHGGKGWLRGKRYKNSRNEFL